MERIKRSLTDTILDYNNNKKVKLQDSSEITINTNKSLFEDLPNETIYEILDYLDIGHAYDAFFILNSRFQNLFLYSNLPIQVNISAMSKSTFERYHKNVIIPNKHRINYLRLSNPFTVDLIFSPPIIIRQFIQLEKLVLDHIHAKYLRNIFRHAIVLGQLHSLVLILADQIEDPATLFTFIFRLRKLKTCKLTYQLKDNENHRSFYTIGPDCSPIEHFVLNTHFPYDSLDILLFNLPKLRHLSINSLIGNRHLDLSLSLISLKHLQYVSLKLKHVHFNQLEPLITHSFRRVKVLRLTTQYDQAYLDAHRWEQLIVSFMPNLRRFDLKHDGAVRTNPLLYHQLLDQFNSSFWTSRGWFFTHQHTWERSLESGMFYSSEPYRRKDYQMYWELEEHLCPHLLENNLNTVQHVHLSGKQVTNISMNYFPKATELTIEHHFQTSDDSILTTLARIVSLEQLTKLSLEDYRFSLEEIIRLIRSTPNLQSIKFNFPFADDQSWNAIKQSEIFQYVSKTNRIQHVHLHQSCRLDHIPFIMKFFPQMKSLKTSLNRKEIGQILIFLFTNQTFIPHLFFLCITLVPKICFQEIDRLIQFNQLLEHYSLKYLKHDLYLWW